MLIKVYTRERIFEPLVPLGRVSVEEKRWPRARRFLRRELPAESRSVSNVPAEKTRRQTRVARRINSGIILC